MNFTEIKKQELDAVRGYISRMQERIMTNTNTNPMIKEIQIDLLTTAKLEETEIEQFLASN